MPVPVPQKGWICEVPEITVNDDDAEFYVRTLQPLERLARGQAEHRFRDACQAMFNNQWVQRTRQAMKKRQAQYAKMGGDPDDFSWTIMQKLYIPGWRTAAHTGDKRMRKLMAELKAAVEELRDDQA